MPEPIVEEQIPAGDKPAGDTGKPAGDKPADGSQQRPGAGEVKPGEDPRLKGILADLQKERSARQAAEARHKEFETQLAAEKKRVAIALGVNPPSKDEQDAEEVKAAFAKLYPHLANLTAEQIEKLQAVASQGDELRSATEKHWTQHGKQMLNKVHTSVASELGGGDLTPRQRQMITNAYIAEARINPEFLERHEAGDETLIEEFVKNFIEDWGGPIRRTITSSEVQRQRPLPNGRGRNVQGQAPKKIDFSNPKAVEDAMVESFKNHGGTFPG